MSRFLSKLQRFSSEQYKKQSEIHAAVPVWASSITKAGCILQSTVPQWKKTSITGKGSQCPEMRVLKALLSFQIA